MIETLRKILWETTYLNPVTPNELFSLKNDEGYLDVLKKTTMRGFEIVVNFYDDDDFVTTYYTFDEDEKVQLIQMDEFGEITVIFDRQQQIKHVLRKINECKVSS
ncbi:MULTISPECIES: hypothetical protein [Bacillaceae]|uniref:Uncharacterized protein n=1 Tax=Alkalicoccobacillus plakortidis TaxID=444060 RepID=A0A9D5DND3_9BACI|nr:MULTISPECIES: hypothetical protein [Bacillaceae]KQL57249.1 hypothetical protein AN965_09890 [Alkalicoccobacillus plakortidis]